MSRRRHTRQLAPSLGLVRVYLSSRGSGARKYVGSSLLRDISDRGIAIQVDTPISVGQKVFLENPYIQYHGRVRNCSASDVGYRIGIELVTAVIDFKD